MLDRNWVTTLHFQLNEDEWIYGNEYLLPARNNCKYKFTEENSVTSVNLVTTLKLQVCICRYNCDFNHDC